MSEEKKKILEMIQKGTLSVEEGMKLLDAVAEEPIVEEKVEIKKKKVKPSVLRVRILNKDGKIDVDINIPLAFAEMLLKFGKGVSKDFRGKMENIDVDELLDRIHSGEQGNLMTIKTESGEVIEIYVE